MSAVRVLFRLKLLLQKACYCNKWIFNKLGLYTIAKGHHLFTSDIKIAQTMNSGNERKIFFAAEIPLKKNRFKSPFQFNFKIDLDVFEQKV